MGRVFKVLLIFLAGVVGIVVIAAVALLLFFDPNDFRDEISTRVTEATGREFAIEGDLSLSLFPWLAVEVGRSRLGNAQGFGDEPFATFEEARLSVQLLPLLLRQEVTVGTATLDALMLNLQVAEDGSTNWEDLAGADEAPPAEGEEPGRGIADLDISNVQVTNSRVAYRDAQAGSTYTVSELSLETGRIVGGQPFDAEAEFDFQAEPGELGGRLMVEGTASISSDFARFELENWNVTGELAGIAPEPTRLEFDASSISVDTNAETVTMGEVALGILGLRMTANVSPFSYAGTPQPEAALQVEPFSLKDLMATMGTEPPVTASPSALTHVAFAAQAALGETALVLRSMKLTLDDTTMTGRLSYPLKEDGLIEFDLAADSINVDAYMAPADAAAEQSEGTGPGDIEIPVDLIRSLQARGSATLERATLSGMLFENLELGVVSRNGSLRLHPLSADLFEGSYEGDVRIDASGQTPAISVNERVAGVSLTPLARSMFQQENVSGTIAGSFELSGRGQNLAQIRQDLDGNMAFELADGAWEGTDIWHQLRTARALFRKEQPPERRNPPRTEFTSVIATGTVTDGIFRNEDLLAELPFLQLTGSGTVDLVEAAIDYSLQARVLERPEFVQDEAELSDFTEAVIPLQVTGSLTSPSIRPDIEGMLKAEVEQAVEEKRDELRDKLVNKLFGGDGEAQDGDAAAEEPEQDEEDKLKNRLRRLFDQ